MIRFAAVRSPVENSLEELGLPEAERPVKGLWQFPTVEMRNGMVSW